MTETLPPADAERFIRERYRFRAGRLTPLGAGEWSQAYACTLDGREVVARFGRYGEDFAKDRVMAAHASDRLPIPAIIDIGPAPGGFFAVSRRAHGEFLDQLDGDQMRVVLPRLLAALQRIRAVDVSSTEGYGGWQPDGWAPHRSWRDALLSVTRDGSERRTHGWRAALEASPTGAGPFDAAVEALETLAARCPDKREIIHGDLLNRNVLVQDGEITAVLDWGNSMYGDGLYDLAWLLYWWPWYPAWRGVDVRAIIDAHLTATAGDQINLDERLRCYQVHIGLDGQAYNAHTKRWDELARTAERTLALSAPRRT